MRRNLLPKVLIIGFALLSTGLTCGTTGLGPRTFPVGALVIPMDNCYQKRDASAPNQTQSCNAASDDGIFRAYGIVYFLLKHNVTVYWTIDGATPKATGVTADVVVPAPTTGISVVKKYNWGTGAMDVFAPAFPVNTLIRYIGGPFIIDPADKATALNLFQTDPDFAPFKTAALVDVHEVQVGFSANQVRPLVGPPPKIAILNIYGPKTSADVMIAYARHAGFDWPCNGACTTGADCDCAGGISKKDSRCTKAYMQTTYGITVNDGPGITYDILCDRDFLPDYTNPSSPDFTRATLLATSSPGPYKLLWAPHWETLRPSGIPTVPDPAAAIGTGPRNLADWLTCINKFVAAGNNLFAECHAIVTLEGGRGTSSGSTPEAGLPITRFQSTNSMNSTAATAIAEGSLLKYYPAEPNMQIADFIFSATSGSVTSYLANPAGTPSSSYRTGVDHFITQTGGSPNRDVFTSIKNAAQGVGGAAVYLGGHSYSSQTAGTRIVLNTLFNLGFGCTDPNTTCNTGKFGICAAGRTKCASGGGLECVQDRQPLPADLCLGQDDNCDGIVNGGCTPTDCTPGVTPPLPCYPEATDCSVTSSTFTCRGKVNGCVDNGDGTFTCTATSPTTPTSICVVGTRTCTASGLWGPCSGAVLPNPEVCNGKDDNCSGAVDEGQPCYPGYACLSGFCMPSPCGAEMSICPIGFSCSAVTGGTCSPVNCPTTPCSVPGQACVGGSCKDPCDGVVCGTGAACSAGSCQGGACYSYGCDAGKICANGNCVSDPCAEANCPVGTFCRAGDCVRSCNYVQCPSGQVCGFDGFCVTSACIPLCISGEVCDAGTCVPDPDCVGVGCGNGQVCTGGACVELPCTHVSCPDGVCVEGQCRSAAPPPPRQADEKKSGGGCGCGSSAGGFEFASLGLAAFAFLRRRRRVALPTLGPTRLAGLMAALVALSLSGCSEKSSNPCVDVQTDPANCGACGNTCQSGWTCSGGSCVLATGNPHLRSISPGPVGVGGTVVFDFAGDTFQAGAVARFKGAGLDIEPPLTVTSPSAARLASPLDLSRATPGTTTVWVLNPGSPGRLISNSIDLLLVSDAFLSSVDLASVQQHVATDDLHLTGDRFASGIVATLTLKEQWDGTPPATSTPVALTTTWVDAQHLTASVSPQTLAIGLYDLQVRNVGAPISNTLAFRVNPGPPTLTGLSQTCATPATGVNLTASGTYFYPTSSGLVTGPVSSVITTACASGIGPLGQCTGGLLAATLDLSTVTVGTYTVSIVNPGNPASATRAFCVKVTCPSTMSCP